MAIGIISSPATWLLGTIVAPTFQQNVEDNINGLIAGIGPSLLGLQIDGTGGAAATPGASHIVVSGTTPGIAAGTGAGTSPPLVAISGNDMRGNFSITAGSSPAASATLCTITFATAFANAPTVQISPFVSVATAALSGNTAPWISSVTTTAITITTQNALVASTAYRWSYLVMG